VRLIPEHSSDTLLVVTAHLHDQCVVSFTINIPQLDQLPFWWLMPRSPATSWIQLESKEGFDMLLFFFLRQLFCPAAHTVKFVCLQTWHTDLSAVHLSSLPSLLRRSNAPHLDTCGFMPGLCILKWQRLSELAKNKLGKSYEKQKSCLHHELLSVSTSLPTFKKLHSATPQDILKFLVWKDRASKTKVHETQYLW